MHTRKLRLGKHLFGMVGLLLLLMLMAGGAQAQSIIGADTFVRAGGETTPFSLENHALTGVAGGAWSKYYSTASQSMVVSPSGWVRGGPITGTANYVASTAAASTEYSVEVDVKVFDTTSIIFPGSHINSVTGAAYYLYYYSGTFTFAKYVVNGGSGAITMGTLAASVAAGSIVHIKISTALSGSNLLVSGYVGPSQSGGVSGVAATTQVGVVYTDTSPLSTGAGGLSTSVGAGSDTAGEQLTNFKVSSLDPASSLALYAAPGFYKASTLFNRFAALPVIAKSSTYEGTVADALAAPAVCYDAAGARWVMLCDGWNSAAGKWYNLAFTSSDLASWSYVTGSKQSPGGTDYITGNGGVVKNSGDGMFYRSFSHYASGLLPTNGVFIASSPDLLTWTNSNAGAAVLTNGVAGNGDNTYLCDSSLDYNPNTGLYEMWYCGQDTAFSGRSVMLATSPNCTTWSKQGIQFFAKGWSQSNMGEPSCFYIGRDRYVTFDAGPVSGNRSIAMASQKNGASTYTFSLYALIPETINSWETTNVFDSTCVGLVDRADGRGPSLWMLYAGGPITATTDATQSGIGLAFAPVPTVGTKRRLQ